MVEAETGRHGDRDEGPAIVLLHGLFGRPSNWSGVVAGLSEEWRVLSPQLPIDPAAWHERRSISAIPALADEVARLCEERRMDRAIVGGNSLGGQVAIAMGLRHPARVEGLVLTGSAGLVEHLTQGTGGRIRMSRAWIRAQAEEVFYDPRHVTDALIDEMQEMLTDRGFRRFIVRVARQARRWDLIDELDQLAVPTLLIWGRQDRITPPSVARAFAERLPRAQLRFLEACGHAPPMERPAAFRRELRRFVRETAGPVIRRGPSS